VAKEHTSTSDAATSNIFKRKHDLYALGLLLLEIGLWESLENTVSRLYTAKGQNKPPRLTSEEVYASISWDNHSSIASLLQFYAGEEFAEATLSCLREELGDGHDSELYFPEFAVKILEHLNGFIH
jgi:hypothetical protein